MLDYLIGVGFEVFQLIPNIIKEKVSIIISSTLLQHIMNDKLRILKNTN